MSELVLAMGVPGSGKSTFIKKRLRDIDTYISRDEIRYSMVKEDEDYFSKENKVIQEFARQISEALLTTKGYVYADATHLNYKSRKLILSKLTTKPEHIYVLFLRTPLEIALERNSKRTGRERVPDKNIINMFNSIQLPQLDEGIEALFTVNEDGKLVYNQTVSYKDNKILTLFNE